MDIILSNMTAISYTAARENLASTMDKVCDDHDPVIITRNRNRAVVMMSLEDYSSLETTAYLMRSPANARRLMEGILELEKGKSVKKKLSDLIEE
jgi:antitoxin YefM